MPDSHFYKLEPKQLFIEVFREFITCFVEYVFFILGSGLVQYLQHQLKQK